VGCGLLDGLLDDLLDGPNVSTGAELSRTTGRFSVGFTARKNHVYQGLILSLLFYNWPRNRFPLFRVHTYSLFNAWHTLCLLYLRILVLPMQHP
jgi:hypothetical protein